MGVAGVIEVSHALTSAATRRLRGRSGFAAEGDVIVEINQEAVTSPQQIAGKVKEAKAQGRRGVLVMVDRQGEQRFVGLSVDKN